ncbi:Ricin-type beta-trefoil lectin domain-like [Leifsonia sp. 98AMF]|nr:Ricin-type beta-trefoil lectin domain-like [Leifsonia sp. 197AMF]SDJ45643.1 Ricin-type beta-trefoil lectin domain-like [Leifsonia sp. 466MF]SDK29864.1 Ricin-type beta-trefoil lectin domain-like [Leifsonia sp. 157MF]SDN66014.1 Ricin-type beta-trefoil lectin domain-like [Leifsonia sp. 509MF]SEN42535.1 Ricin-type beta-trefoil lectin domain-like [Leifsonia sp. 467MF]SFM92084.1 Ricin-type beta-trefoil lectin domain-like [Leifsonia sp. 98AMF]
MRDRDRVLGFAPTRLKRAVAMASATIAGLAMLVPIAGAETPAAAWEALPANGVSRCETLPDTAVFSIVLESVPQEFQSSLIKAAAEWDEWSGSTGVGVKVVPSESSARPGSHIVPVRVYSSIPEAPTGLAGASMRCAGSPSWLSGGQMAISTARLGGKSETYKREIFLHEIGHLLGVGHNTGQWACATVMLGTANYWSMCGNGAGPYVDDVAAVVAIWKPQQTPSLPAESRIFPKSVGSGSQLLSSYASTAGYRRAVSFGSPNSQGYADWTFVPDKGETVQGWGWLVNSASGLCLTEGSNSYTHMGYCDNRAAQWMVGVFSERIHLESRATRRCLSTEGGYARLALSCGDSSTHLKAEKSSTARAKRSIPDVLNPADAIVGWGSKRCVTVTGGARTAGAGLSIRTCDGSVEQKWMFHPLSGGGYLLGVYPQFVDNPVDEPSPELCAQGSGGTVSLAPCDLVATQIWRLPANGTILNQWTGTCLNVSGAATGDGAPLILYSCGTAPNAAWSVPEALRTTAISLASVAMTTGGVLGTAPAPAGDPDQRVRGVLTRTSTEAAKWGYVEVEGTGGGVVQNLESGMCLRWRGKGAQVGLDQACDGADSSYRWGPTVTATGAWTLQSQYTGECLDLLGGSSTEGAAIGTYACTGGTNQLWRAVPYAPLPVAP